ncbi:MAG TPA: DUF1521 domain-containing protein, partial [Bauldia sp.]|nr:DUF1521 domain-containing protein [Bauldia sp.]
MAVSYDFSVANDFELRDALLVISRDFAADSSLGDDYTITLTDNITLGQSLPMIRGDGTHTVTIVGGGFTIDADGNGRVFFVESGTVEISNLTIANAVAQGGNGGTGASEFTGDIGGGGGGGGLGAG